MATTQEIRNFIKLVRQEQDTRNAAKFALKTEIASGLRYKGSVDTYADLPASGLTAGDVYNIRTAGGTDDFGKTINAGDNLVRTADDKWDALAGTVDLSAYYTSAQVDTALAAKVDKVTGKQLSTNDYTTAEKTKLGGISEGAQVNVIETVKVDGTALAVDGNKAVNVDLSGKVDKVAGKQLSTEDYTTAEKTLLASLSTAVNTDFTSADLTYIFTD